MATSTYECSFIDDILSETDDIKREGIINQLKNHLIELENNNKFVEDLSQKFTTLQDEFKRLSLSKKQIETELNNKISLLQLENERLTNKYISAQEQINSMINSKTNNYQQHMNIQIENDINYEKKNLISQKEHDESILFYQKQLEEANSSIMRLNNMVQNLEEKNQSIMDKCYSRMELSANKEVIIGLKRVIDEKEKTISNLYNKYDKLSIKYEDVIKQNGILHEEVMVLRNERVGSYQNYCNNNIKGGYQ